MQFIQRQCFPISKLPNSLSEHAVYLKTDIVTIELYILMLNYASSPVEVFLHSFDRIALNTVVYSLHKYKTKLCGITKVTSIPHVKR